MMNFEQLQRVYFSADCLYSLQEVESALDELIPKIITDLGDKNPIVLGVMNGSLPTLGYLLPRIPCALEVDYIHATRYQGALQGQELVWKRKPDISLKDRYVLLVDDLLDQGITLKAIADYCIEQGATQVKVAVLATKKIPGYQAPIHADYSALEIPDKFVFGFGMDYQNYWRNAPGIFVCADKT